MNFIWFALISLLVSLKHPDPRIIALGIIVTAMVIVNNKESMDVVALQKSIDVINKEVESLQQMAAREQALLAVGTGKQIMAMEMSEEESGAPIRMGKDVKRSFEDPAEIPPVASEINNQSVEIKEVMEQQ